MPTPLALVTGASRGIGRAIASGLLRAGYHVLVHARDREKGEAALEHLRAGGGGERLELVTAELSSLRSIGRMAQAVRADHRELQLLVHNAATVPPERRVTSEGLETQFAVNHLAPFFLTRLLGELLEKGAPSQVITLSSEAHRAAKPLDFENLQGEKSYGRWTNYSLTKLLNLHFTYALAERSAAGSQFSGVKANAIHPGLIATELPGDIFTPMRLLGILGGSTDKGAAPVLQLAANAHQSGFNGAYFHRFRKTRSSEASYDREAWRRLWQVSSELSGLPQD